MASKQVDLTFDGVTVDQLHEELGRFQYAGWFHSQTSWGIDEIGDVGSKVILTVNGKDTVLENLSASELHVEVAKARYGAGDKLNEVTWGAKKPGDLGNKITLTCKEEM